MLRAQKIERSDKIRTQLEGSHLVIVVRHQGLTVSQVNELRRDMRAQEGSLCVVKNRLVPFALEGSDFLPLNDFVKGPCAFACAYGDVASLAKVVTTFAKETEKMEICGGMMDGSLLEASAIKELASLPPLSVLRGRIVGALRAPATQLASLLVAPSGAVARVLGAYARKG